MTFEEAVIREFETGQIVYQNLSQGSINDLAVRVAGKRVTATWYPPYGFGMGRPRSVEIDGTSYPSEITPIVRAAQVRAKSLVREVMASLDSLVSDKAAS